MIERWPQERREGEKGIRDGVKEREIGTKAHEIYDATITLMVSVSLKGVQIYSLGAIQKAISFHYIGIASSVCKHVCTCRTMQYIQAYYYVTCMCTHLYVCYACMNGCVCMYVCVYIDLCTMYTTGMCATMFACMCLTFMQRPQKPPNRR